MQTSKPQRGRPNAISLGDEEEVRQAVSEAVLGLWDVVNNLTRLAPARRERYRVTILVRLVSGAGRSATTKPGVWLQRWLQWAATSSPAAARG